jgi:hypothetical protein
LINHDFIAATPAPEVTMDDDHRSAVVACSLGPGDLARRAGRWEVLTARSLMRAARTDRGMRLEFRAGPGVAGELSALVELERECCAFAAWTVHTTGAELTLDVSGDAAEAVTAIQSLFPALA